MDILFSIVTGLGLRIICLNLTEPLTRLSPVIIGVWEGALSHLVLSQDPELQQSTFDHFLAYGLRLVFDLILTQDPARPLAVILWTGISLWLCQYIDQQTTQQNIRRKRSRRHRTSATSSLPSHVRVYQTPQPQSDLKPQTVPPDSLPHTPPHEQPSTPPSFFLQGEDSEAIHLSPAPDQPLSSLVDPLPPPSALAPQLEVDDGEAQDRPVPFPTPPATFASPEADKDLTSSARRLSTIVETSSGEEVPIVATANLGTGAVNVGAQSTLPERKEQDQNVNGARITTTRTDTVPLPVPDPFSRQLRSRASAQASIVAGSESATLISVNPSTAHKFLLRPYPEEEVLSDELQTPLNPVSRALLEDDADHVFTDNELDELRTPLKLTRQLADGPLSPLSPLLSVQLRLSDVQLGSSTKPPSGTQIPGTADAMLARSSLLISSEADDLDSVESDADSSMLSTAVPTELYAHGDDWRKKAREEEKNFSELKKQYDKAMKELRVKDALMLKGQIAESDAKIKKLHEKAARRYYKARNNPGQVQLVDVHGLRVEEAVEMTEKALRNALSSGHRTLRVITGRGLHSKGKLPILRPAVQRAMEAQKIPCERDPANPGVLIVTLPP